MKYPGILTSQSTFGSHSSLQSTQLTLSSLSTVVGKEAEDLRPYRNQAPLRHRRPRVFRGSLCPKSGPDCEGSNNEEIFPKLRLPDLGKGLESTGRKAALMCIKLTVILAQNSDRGHSQNSHLEFLLFFGQVRTGASYKRQIRIGSGRITEVLAIPTWEMQWHRDDQKMMS